MDGVMFTVSLTICKKNSSIGYTVQYSVVSIQFWTQPLSSSSHHLILIHSNMAVEHSHAHRKWKITWLRETELGRMLQPWFEWVIFFIMSNSSLISWFVFVQPVIDLLWKAQKKIWNNIRITFNLCVVMYLNTEYSV